LLSERSVGPVIFCRNHEPGGILIEPMYNAWSQLSPDPGEVFAMFKKAVDKGSG